MLACCIIHCMTTSNKASFSKPPSAAQKNKVKKNLFGAVADERLDLWLQIQLDKIEMGKSNSTSRPANVTDNVIDDARQAVT